jgi:hypothetical protein
MPAVPISPRTRALRAALASAAVALALWSAPAIAHQAPRSLVVPAPLADLVPVQTIPSTASPDLVQLFADWMKRHPIGSTVPPSQARVLGAEELPGGLPALAQGRRYAVFDGMIVEIDAAYKLIRLVRRAPTEAAAPAPASGTAPAPTAQVPAPEAPTSSANATANANASANVTVNINTDDDGDEEEGDDDNGDDEGNSSASRVLSIAEAEARGIRIPRGHQPEAGTCRLWIPGTPPGRQPRGSVSCEEDDIPEGAFLIRG